MMIGGMSSLFSYSSDLEAGNLTGSWSTVDSKGENVTVNTMDTKGTFLSMFGKNVGVAFWNLDESRYALIMSSFDKNTTSQIIKTLKIS